MDTHRISEPHRSVRYQQPSGYDAQRERAAKLAAELGEPTPEWARPDRWSVACQCGWQSRSHTSKADAIEDGDEHQRIMGHAEP